MTNCRCKVMEKINNLKFSGSGLFIMLKIFPTSAYWEYFILLLLIPGCSMVFIVGGYFQKLQYVDKLWISQNQVIRIHNIILNRLRRESSYRSFRFLKILPLPHLYVYKVFNMLYVRSGNTGTNPLFYQTGRNENF